MYRILDPSKKRRQRNFSKNFQKSNDELHIILKRSNLELGSLNQIYKFLSSKINKSFEKIIFWGPNFIQKVPTLLKTASTAFFRFIEKLKKNIQKYNFLVNSFLCNFLIHSVENF